jgi:hypothetical protein
VGHFNTITCLFLMVSDFLLFHKVQVPAIGDSAPAETPGFDFMRRLLRAG